MMKWDLSVINLDDWRYISIEYVDVVYGRTYGKTYICIKMYFWMKYHACDVVLLINGWSCLSLIWFLKYKTYSCSVGSCSLF